MLRARTGLLVQTGRGKIMTANGKSYRAALEKVDRNQRYLLEEGLRLAKETARAKFDETVELAVRLGVDPRQADQNVRGTVTLPHGMGKTVRVLAFAKGEKEKEAQEAGADFVGGDDLIKKISEGWFDFDKAVATPEDRKSTRLKSSHLVISYAVFCLIKK